MTQSELRAFIQGVVVSNEGKIIISTISDKDEKLYKKIENKLANKLTVLSSFTCTKSSKKYETTVIGQLEPI